VLLFEPPPLSCAFTRAGMSAANNDTAMTSNTRATCLRLRNGRPSSFPALDMGSPLSDCRCRQFCLSSHVERARSRQSVAVRHRPGTFPKLQAQADIVCNPGPISPENGRYGSEIADTRTICLQIRTSARHRTERISSMKLLGGVSRVSGPLKCYF
jgi:hypothetical protein